MEMLEERILEVLLMSGPTAFDAIKDQLEVTDDELTEALNALKASGHVESAETNGFCWSLVPQ